jgi:hypothetical protein
MRKTIASAAVALSTAALTFGLAGAAHAAARHDRKRFPLLRQRKSGNTRSRGPSEMPITCESAT